MAITAASGTWAIGDNWPWPRMFIIDNYVLAFVVEGTNLTLFELICDTNAWTATKIVELGTLTRIDSIDVASFGKYYIVTASGYNTSGDLWTTMYERQPNASPRTTAVLPISSGVIPHGTTICNYKNQILIGGLNTNEAKWSSLGSCAVAYGGIGNKVFDPETDPSSGFLKMPWDIENQGQIFKIERLADDVIVYGDRGVEKLTPFANDKITGFGQDTIWDGVLGFNCIGCAKNVHCFIDLNHDLCIISDKLQVLGYRQFMKNLTAANIIISYEPSLRYFYISDGVLCYVLTENGLYSTHQCVSSIGRYNNILCGFFKNSADTKIRLVTTETDLGYQALKSLENVEFGVRYVTGADIPLYLRASTRYDYKESFVDLGWTHLNERGIATQKLSGRTFKIGLQGTYDSDGDFSLGSLEAKVKFIDKRNIRGRINVR